MAKWIWNDLAVSKDDYAVFVGEFSSESGLVDLKISVDTDYMVYINNKLVAFGQYPCFPLHPVYDEVKARCKKGINKVKVLVYYFGGEEFSTYYYSPQPGLYFEIKENDKTLLESNESILSGRFLAFKHGMCDIITPQLGYRHFFDANKANKSTELRPSIVVDKSYDLEVRLNKKLKLFPFEGGTILKNETGHILIDLGKETTGYLDVDFISNKKQKMLITWGEHIVDGKVRYLIENRNFSTEFSVKKGRNKYFYTFRRLGLRYLEIYFEDEIKINKFGVRPAYYPFKERKPFIKDNPLREKIYEVAVRTLKCCYHEHFEDCPWREQSYYPMDSRNQLLFHYVAFNNKEAIRSALHLCRYSTREDHLLGITIPSTFKLTIPSYSLYFTEECYLYATLYKDIEFLEEMHPFLTTLIKAFTDRIKDGLLQNYLHDKNYWNFYEWIDGLDYPEDNVESDVILNSLLIISLVYMDKINKLLGKEEIYQEQIKSLRKAARKAFYDKEKGLFIFAKANPRYYTLANSFACLAGLATKKEMAFIAEELIHNKEIVHASVALKVFMYDVLMIVDKKKYRDYILNDIDTVFKKQLDQGATTFWETELGEADFNGAGSLCHAWCALSVYYYKKLL